MGAKIGLCYQWKGIEYFEKGALRRIFELKLNEILSSWRRMHNEERSTIYS
jgi:hypothetical protein